MMVMRIRCLYDRNTEKLLFIFLNLFYIIEHYKLNSSAIVPSTLLEIVKKKSTKDFKVINLTADKGTIKM